MNNFTDDFSVRKCPLENEIMQLAQVTSQLASYAWMMIGIQLLAGAVNGLCIV